MATGHVFIATSVDGFIARRDGDIAWLERPGTDGEDHGYDDFVAAMDGIVMGRGSYQAVLGFAAWPYDRPVVVLSRTLAGTPVPPTLAGRVRFSSATPAAAMEEAAAAGWRRVYVDGGAVVRSFLAEGLIAELTLTRIPILLGDGLPLFGTLPHDIALEHLGTVAFRSGLTQSRYRVAATG